MKNISKFSIPLLFSLAILSVQAQSLLYKSVTPDGKVIYSDRPPTDSKVIKTITPQKAPSSSLPVSAQEQLRRIQALSPKPSPVVNNNVVLFSASWCGYCRQAKAYLSKMGIAYQEIDIDKPEGVSALAQAGGSKGIPLLMVGDRRLQGFSVGAYDEFFKKN